jgi:hypothetical protein
MNIGRFQIVMWWHPRDWAVCLDWEPFPDKGEYRGCIYRLWMQLGPFDVRCFS